MLPKTQLIHQMLEQKRIRCVDAQQVQMRQQQERMSLKQLQQRKSTYLNHYDQLFRYVNLWLLDQGCDLTNYEPHQVLKAVCVLHRPYVDIQVLIQHRHQLKKGLLDEVNSEHWEQLIFTLNDLKDRLQAYDL